MEIWSIDLNRRLNECRHGQSGLHYQHREIVGNFHAWPFHIVAQMQAYNIMQLSDQFERACACDVYVIRRDPLKKQSILPVPVCM